MPSHLTTVSGACKPSRLQTATRVPRVAVVCDLIEEGWISMDTVGQMLLQHLQQEHADVVSFSRICPPLRRRFTRLPALGSRHTAFNADRFLNRYYDYPRVMRGHKDRFDLFHIVDHSYAHLVSYLTPQPTVVACHDVEVFRCLLEPGQAQGSVLLRAVAQHILHGLRQATRVICGSRTTRDELLVHELIPPERIAVVPYGVHPACSPEPDLHADCEAARLLGPASADTIEILHVGSTIQRKRIDVLLQVFAALRREFPTARLVRVGGPFTPEQRALITELDLHKSVVVLPFLTPPVLAAVYRRAAVLLLPSAREGFGLPIIEAMACGTPVIASDLPVSREVGGEAAIYCPVADVAAWCATVAELLYERHEQPECWARRQAVAIARAVPYSWNDSANMLVSIYQDMVNTTT